MTGTPPATSTTVTGLTNGTAYTFTVTATNAIGTGPASAPSNPVTPSSTSCSACTIWAASATPTAADEGDPSSVELGVKFTSDLNGVIKGIRFYKSAANTGTHIGNLWTASGTKLASATFTGETASGWQQVNFATAVPVTAGTVYVASYFAPAGHYAGDGGYFAASGVDNAPLHALKDGVSGGNGVYVYGSASGFPNLTFNSENYWVDAVFSTGPATVPTAPTNVTATAANASAQVSWTAPSDGGSPLTSYTVTPFIGTTAQTPTTVTGTPPATTTTVTGLTNGTAYTFTVSATNAVGTGPASAPSSAVTPTAPTAPGAPTAVNALAGAGSAQVSWTAPSNGGSAITKYTVTPFIGTTAQTPTTVTGSPPATSTTVTGLTNGTAYTFTVTATNAIGTGPASAPSNAVTPTGPTAPAAPTAVTATPANASAQVSWTAPANGGSAITSYTVTPFIGATAQTPTTVTGTPPATTTTVTGLTNGTAYTFTVTATNAIGTGPASAPSSAVTPTAPTAPGAPTGVTATAGNASAVVSWTAPSNGGSAITSYTVTPFVGATAQTPTTVTGTPPATTTTVTGLTNGTAYTFTVTATNAIGTGAASAASNPVTPAVTGCSACTIWAPSATPTGVDEGDPSSVELGVKFTSDLNGVIKGIRFYKSAANTGTHIGSLWTASGTKLASATFSGETASGWQQVNFATPVSITANTVYVASYFAPAGHYAGDGGYFAASGVDNAPLHALKDGVSGGNGVYVYGSASGFPNQTFNSENYWVDAVFGAGAATAPAAPTAVTAAAGNASAQVSWTAPANGGSAITSYTVTPFIGTTAQTPTTVTGTPPATSTTVSGLTNGTAYTFTVTATNAVGTGPASAASNSITPTAPTAPAAPTGVTATAGNASAQVSWTAPANGGSAITSYTVTPFIGTTAQTPTTVTGTPPATSTTVTGLTNGTAYTFTVTATNAIGTGPASAPSSAVTPIGLTAPGAPAIVAAMAANASAQVSWTAPSDGGSAITSYTVTPFIGTTAQTPTTVTGTPPATSTTVTGLTNGTAYTFTVSATNAIGTGPASAASNPVTPSATSCGACTIWASSATPTTPSTLDTGAVTLGVKFKADVSGKITGIRFYKGTGNTGTHVANLWSATGTKLATGTFSNETASGWQQVNFTTPVSITAGTVYVASYFAPVGHYAADGGYFAAVGVDNGLLHALKDGVSGGDGVYAYGSAAAFPSNTFLSTNYWVDVVFATP